MASSKAVLHRRRGDRASTSGLALVLTLSRLARSETVHDDPLVCRPVRTCTVDTQHQIIVIFLNLCSSPYVANDALNISMECIVSCSW